MLIKIEASASDLTTLALFATSHPSHHAVACFLSLSLSLSLSDFYLFAAGAFYFHRRKICCSFDTGASVRPSELPRLLKAFRLVLVPFFPLLFCSSSLDELIGRDWSRLLDRT